jgi:hypothetical protein
MDETDIIRVPVLAGTDIIRSMLIGADIIRAPVLVGADIIRPQKRRLFV